MRSRNWRKSTRSSDQGNCVEVAEDVLAYVRDSKLGGASPVLAFTTDSWRSFIRRLKS